MQSFLEILDQSGISVLKRRCRDILALGPLDPGVAAELAALFASRPQDTIELVPIILFTPRMDTKGLYLDLLRDGDFCQKDAVLNWAQQWHEAMPSDAGAELVESLGRLARDEEAPWLRFLSALQLRRITGRSPHTTTAAQAIAAARRGEWFQDISSPAEELLSDAEIGELNDELKAIGESPVRAGRVSDFKRSLLGRREAHGK